MKKKSAVVISFLAGMISGLGSASYFKNKSLSEKDKKVEKFKGYYNLLNQWMINMEEGKNIEQYFIKHNYKTIAIYGMGELGNRFYEQIAKGGKIEINYAIDKETCLSCPITIYDPEESNLPEVDAIVVTALFAFDEVSTNLGKFSMPIISLEDVIYGII